MSKAAMDEILAKLKSMDTKLEKLDKLEKQVNDLASKLKKLDKIERLEKLCDELALKITSLEFELEEMKGERNKKEGEYFNTHQDLLAKIDGLENHQRRSNLVISGLSEKANESWVDTEEIVTKFLKEKLDIEAPIERAHRLGTKQDRDRLTIVRLKSYTDKTAILKKRTMLRGSNCFINEDFSTKVRQERSMLVKFAKTKFPGKKFRLTYNKLILDEKKFVVGNVGIAEVK